MDCANLVGFDLDLGGGGDIDAIPKHVTCTRLVIAGRSRVLYSSERRVSIDKEEHMARITTASVEIFGTGVLRAEGVVVDREGNVWGGGRNAKVYKVTPD